ncbi:hypothetical protein O3S80_40925 [Streptomyces sp. Lzd4kr]|nr:hypothetical protein [Streptomyces sp. Lzd4kr]
MSSELVAEDDSVNDTFDFTVEISETSPIEVVQTIDDTALGLGPGVPARCN